jgi:hypothetical protein
MMLRTYYAFSTWSIYMAFYESRENDWMVVDKWISSHQEFSSFFANHYLRSYTTLLERTKKCRIDPCRYSKLCCLELSASQFPFITASHRMTSRVKASQTQLKAFYLHPSCHKTSLLIQKAQEVRFSTLNLSWRVPSAHGTTQHSTYLAELSDPLQLQVWKLNKYCRQQGIAFLLKV